MARNCIKSAGSLVTLIFFSLFVCMCCPTRDVGHVLNPSLLQLGCIQGSQSCLHRSIMFPLTTSRDPVLWVCPAQRNYPRSVGR